MMEQYEELRDEFEQVRDHGDVLDAHASLKTSRGFRVAAVTQGIAMVPATIDTNIAQPLEYAVTYPVFGLSAAATAGVIHGTRKLYERRKINASEHTQQAIRAQLNEPVDVLRYGPRKDRQLLIRWYGADGLESEAETYGIGMRLRRLADEADKRSVSLVAVGADFLGNIDMSDEAVYGEPAEGKTMMTGVKKRRSVDTFDMEADDSVRLLTPDQARSLAERLRSSGEQHLVHTLLERIGNQYLLDAYQEVIANPGHRGRFVSLLRAHLSRAIDNDTQPTRQRKLSDSGVPIYSRAQTTHLILPGHDGKVSQFNSVRQYGSKESHTEHESITSLLTLVGARTREELIERLLAHTTAEKPDVTGILTAVYLLSMDPEAAVVDGRGLGGEEAGRHIDDTLFHRLATTHKPHTAPMLRPWSGESIAFRHRRRGLRRLVAGLMIVGASLTAGYEAGHQLENEYVRLYFQNVEEFKKANHLGKSDIVSTLDDQYREYEQTHQSTYSKDINGLFGFLEDTNIAASDQMTNLYLSTLGEGFLQRLYGSSYVFNPNTDSRVQFSPNEPYATVSGEQSIGDVFSADSKTPLFSITSLTGKPTEGYWYESTQPIMNLGPADTFAYTTFPFKDFGLTYDSANASLGRQVRTLELPSDVASIDSLQPDFMVDSRLPVNSFGDIALPVLEGYEVVGAQIVDAARSTHVIVPRVTLDTRSHSYSTDVSVDGRDKYNNMVDPRLRYWLKAVSGQKSTDHFVEPLEYPGFNAYAHSEKPAKPQEVAARVRTALGLPAGATDTQVMQAIRDSKYYSFHPFTDAGVTSILIGTGTRKQDDTGILANLGGVLAHLDALNCNLASTELILATGGTYQGEKINPVVGFMNDGNNKLTQDESHAWVVNAKGEIIDPTPTRDMGSKLAEAKHPAQNNIQEDAFLAAIALATMFAAGVATRRRKQIQALSDRVRTGYATSGLADEALHTIRHVVYGKPGSRVHASGPVITSSTKVAEKFVLGVAPGAVSIRALRQQMRNADRHGYEQLPGATRRAVRRMARHQHAIRRHYSRQK